MLSRADGYLRKNERSAICKYISLNNVFDIKDFEALDQHLKYHDYGDRNFPELIDQLVIKHNFDKEAFIRVVNEIVLLDRKVSFEKQVVQRKIQEKLKF